MEAVMKWQLLAITSVCLLGSWSESNADDYDNRTPACGETGSFRRMGRPRLFGCLPFCCIEECDDLCDCDSPCCEYCGRKRRTPKPRHSFLSCLGCEEIPRGPVGMAIAARINDVGDGAAESQLERGASGDAGKRGSEAGLDQSNPESQDRISRLESDMTRLTFVVEELARNQQEQQKDLSRMTFLLEKLAQ